MMKVSIIVPVYNSEKDIERCLDSLTNQTLKEIEIIVVNDGSTDNSKNIILNYIKKDDRVKLFNKENGGQSSARNLGLTKATGKYIAYVDSDDYVDSKMCEEMYKTATQNNCDIVVADYYIAYNDKNNYTKVIGNAKKGIIPNEKYFFAGTCPWNKIYKTEFLKNINFKFPEGIILEDYAVVATLVKYNPKIFYINKAYLYYVQNSSSTMRSDVYKTKYEDIFKANEILYNELKDTKYKDELEYLMIYHMLYLGSLNFYRFKKYEQIDKISDFIRKRFPNFRKNKYLKNKKEKLLMTLFYYKKYNIIKICQKIKRCFKCETK